MSTNAKIGHSAIFQLGDGETSEAFVTIAGITNIGPPGLQRDTIDVTDMQSTNRWRQFIGGLRDGGEVSFDMDFLPASASEDAILAAFNDDDSRTAKITFPNGAIWSFASILTGYEPAVPMDDKMTATVTLKVSGQPTLTDPS